MRIKKLTPEEEEKLRLDRYWKEVRRKQIEKTYEKTYEKTEKTYEKTYKKTYKKPGGSE